MAQFDLSLILPDLQEGDIIDSFVKNLGYQDTVVGKGGSLVANPESKKEAFRRLIIEYVMSNYSGYQVHVTMLAAKDQMMNSIKDVVIS